MGLLQAVELVEDRKTKAPATAATAQVMEAARENRILLGKGGMFGNVLRFSPPMNIGSLALSLPLFCFRKPARPPK